MIVGDPSERARDLITFCDGLEEGGLPLYARKARAVARDVLELVACVDSLRSLVATQDERIAGLRKDNLDP